MTILIDIDGVIFNTQETLLKWLNSFHLLNYTIEDITSYDWFDKTFIDPWEPMEFEEFWNDIAVNQQAIDYILKWKHEGHNIKFVTATYYHHALPYKIYKLLDYFKGEFNDKDVIICHDKEMIKGNILIDDCYDNINKFAMNFGYYGILYKQPWNFKQFIDKESNCKIWCYDTWNGIDSCIQYLNENG